MLSFLRLNSRRHPVEKMDQGDAEGFPAQNRPNITTKSNYLGIKSRLCNVMLYITSMLSN